MDRLYNKLAGGNLERIAALCVIGTYWSIGFIVLMQGHYAIAPRQLCSGKR